jgi:hypothetical protein
MNERFESFKNNDSEFFISKERQAFDRVLYLLLASHLNSDMCEKDLIKLYKKDIGNKSFTSVQEMIYWRSFKEGRLNHSQIYLQQIKSLTDYEKINDSSQGYRCLFLACDRDKCKEISDSHGIIVKGVDFSYDGFYEDVNLLVTTTDQGLNQLELIKHESNSMIIIDPYFFHGPKKMVNVISAIKRLIPENLKLKFHLTIIAKNPENNGLIRSSMQKLLDSLGGKDKFFIEVYAPRSLSDADRYILTNYSTISIGHPFDRMTSISSNCFISQDSTEKIKASFRMWKSKIDFVKKVIKDTPNSYGGIESVHKTEDAVNRLLL